MSTIQLYEHVEGTSGPTLVFSHGWADDSSAWGAVVAALSGRYRCVVWDLRGHGASDVAVPGAYGRDLVLDDLDAVIANHRSGEEPVVLIGHSLGGYLSLATTLRHPGWVSALVLIAAGPGFRKPESREKWNRAVRLQAGKLGVPEGSDEIAWHVDSWVIDELSGITQPTLVMLGERDKRFGAAASLFERDLDVRNKLIVSGAGHSVHRSHPAIVAAAIDEFLQAALQPVGD